MKKFIFGLVGFVILALIAAIIFVSTQITTIVETAGSKVLGAPVTVGSVKIDAFKGGVEVSDVRIGNPEGYASDYAFDLTSVKARVDLNSLLTDVLVVEEIIIDAPKIQFEGSLTDNNIAHLVRNVKANAAPVTAETTPVEDEKVVEEASSTTNVALMLFELKNAELTVTANTPAGQQSINQVVPSLRVTNIGTREEGVTPAVALEMVLKSVTKVTDRIALSALDDLKGVISNGVDNLKGKMKDLTKGLLNF